MKNFELTIFKLIAREIKITYFEQWVYSEKGLEDLLTSDEYLDLISLRYKLPSSLYEAEKILIRYIDLGKYYEWRLKRVLQKVIERPPDAHIYIVQCYDLYCDGYSFLENLGLGYGLAITALPSCSDADNWEELESKKQIELIDSFYPKVRKEAEKVLCWLNSKKIILIGTEGDFEDIIYQDNRTKEEKLPTGNKIATPIKKKWWNLW